MNKSSSLHLGSILAAVILAAIAIAAAFYFRPYAATTDFALLASDTSISVENRSFGTVFLPRSGNSSVGFAFYQEAKVPREAYAYLGRAMAQKGHVAVLLSSPLDFAVFAASQASAARMAFPEVKAWVIGGHALGGAVAASFCAASPEKVKGLLLLAAYPGGGANLSASNLPVVSVSASNDGIATPAKISAARSFLPSTARYVAIAGGNHAQFGEYGLQPGDGVATVPPAMQRQAVVEEALGLMDRALESLR